MQLDDAGEDIASTGLECRLAMDEAGQSHLVDERLRPLLFCHLHNRKNAQPLNRRMPTIEELARSEIAVRAGAADFLPSGAPLTLFPQPAVRLEVLPPGCFRELAGRTQLLGSEFTWDRPLGTLKAGTCDAKPEA